MELSLFLQEINDASKAQDHFKMISAMQKFFTEIHKGDTSNGSELLGIYSMARQLELMGLKADAIKDAVISRITSQQKAYPSTWKETAIALNSLLGAYSSKRIKF